MSHSFTSHLCLNLPFAGGLITYVKADRFVHTLNTPSGMRRKLTAMDIGTHLLPPMTAGQVTAVASPRNDVEEEDKAKVT